MKYTVIVAFDDGEPPMHMDAYEAPDPDMARDAAFHAVSGSRGDSVVDCIVIEGDHMDICPGATP